MSTSPISRQRSSRLLIQGWANADAGLSLAGPRKRPISSCGQGRQAGSAAQRSDPVLRAAHQIIAVAQRVPDPESLVTGVEQTRCWRNALPRNALIRSKSILLAHLLGRAGYLNGTSPGLGAAEHLRFAAAHPSVAPSSRSTWLLCGVALGDA